MEITWQLYTNIHNKHQFYIVVCFSFQTNWPKNGIEFAEYMYKRFHESSAVVIDDETCMANDNADKVQLHMCSSIYQIFSNFKGWGGILSFGCHQNEIVNQH